MCREDYSLKGLGNLKKSSGFKRKGRDFPGGPVVKTLPSSAGREGLITGQGAKIPHVLWPKSQNIKQKQYRDKFNKDFKNGPHKKKKNFKKKRKGSQY